MQTEAMEIWKCLIDLDLTTVVVVVTVGRCSRRCGHQTEAVVTPTDGGGSAAVSEMDMREKGRRERRGGRDEKGGGLFSGLAEEIYFGCSVVHRP